MKPSIRKIFPFGYKLMISYWVFVLIPVIAIGYFSYTSNVDSIIKQTKTNITGTLQQTRDNILYNTQSLVRISDQIFFDEGMQTVLGKHFTDFESYEKTNQFLIPMLYSVLYQTDNRANVRIYLQNETIPEIYFQQSEEDPLRRGKYFEIYHMNRIQQQTWYQSLDLGNLQLLWRQVESDSIHGNISLIRKMVDFEKQDQKGLIRIIGSIKDIFQAVDYSKTGERSYLLVFNERNKLVLESGHSPLPVNWEQQLNKYLVIRQQLPGMDWQLTALVPLSDLEKSAIRVRNITIFISIITFVILALVGGLVAQYFSKRITKLVNSLQAFQLGEFNKRITYTGRDEFALISTAFNEMAKNTQQLIRKVYIVEIEKKEAELTALQAQINPHFLYNTLSSISRLAKLGEVDKLHEMVIGLSKFYRLSLNQGRSIISIFKELQQAQAYLDIQKIKFMSRMEVMYDIDTSVFQYDTIKLILQPFIENVLEHALYGDKINIRITAHMVNSTIVFKVIDDGIGMNQDTIKQIFNQDGIQVGYGIRNVDKRIKLQFDPTFGVSIHSRVGMGTTVQIVIPVYNANG
jgi:two-component system sensor histidine kinase YesM